MSFTASAIFSFGSSRTGLTDLRCQPLTLAQAATGSALTATFVEKSRGIYGWSGSVPDDAVWLQAYSAATPTLLSVRPAVQLNTGRVASDLVSIGGNTTYATALGSLMGPVVVFGGYLPVVAATDGEEPFYLPTVSDIQAGLATSGAVAAISTSIGNLPTTLAGSTSLMTAISTAVEGHLINEADGQQLLAAIVSKINATDVNLAGLSTSAIANAVAGYLMSNATTPGTLAYVLAQLRADYTTALSGKLALVGTNDGDSPAAKIMQGRVDLKLSDAIAATVAASGSSGNERIDFQDTEVIR